MKKVALTIAIICAFNFSAKAQDGPAEKTSLSLTREGANNLSIGIGTGNISQDFLRETISSANDASITFKAVGPLFLKYEHMVSDKIGFGVNIAYMKNTIGYSEEGLNDSGDIYNYNAELACATFSALARFNYHFMDHDKIDPYVGVGVGYRAVNWSYKDNDPFGDSDANEANIALGSLPSSPFGMDLTFGLRFLPHPNIGLYMEAGIAKGVIQGGLTFSL